MYITPLDRLMAQLGPVRTPELKRTQSGLYVPKPVATGPKPLVGVDLFSGAGGFSLGFHQSGFHVVAAVEWDVWASMTYLCNLGSPDVKVHYNAASKERIDRALNRKAETKRQASADPLYSYRNQFGTNRIAGQPAPRHGCEHFWLQDIKTVTGAEILEAIGMEKGEVDVVFGGPPCQGFSRAGRQHVMDPRNSYVFDFARIVLDLMPRAVVMENVPGILDMVTEDGVPVVDALSHMLSQGGMGTYNSIRDMLVSQQENDMTAGLAGDWRVGSAQPADSELELF